MLSGIQTESIVNICSVPMYTSVCPNRYQVSYTLGQKKLKKLFPYSKLVAMKTFEMHLIDALYQAV